MSFGTDLCLECLWVVQIPDYFFSGVLLSDN